MRQTTVLAALAAALFSLAFANSLLAGSKATVEFLVDRETIVGREVARASNRVFLLSRDGQIHPVEPAQIKKQRDIDPQFKGLSVTLIRDQVRRELGDKFAAATTRHYAVFARNERVAQQYANVFEDLYRSYQRYFSVRGFTIPEPEFGLVAIVFPDRASFAKYAETDGVKISTGMKGYYISTTNRVAMFEEQAPGVTLNADEDEGPDIDLDGFAFGSINGSTRDTVIHEATHQLAFNTGLHTRWGQNPKWVVEGLATVFEAPGIRNTGSGIGPDKRINPERFLWFGNYLKERRKPKSLESVIASDALFEGNALDAYSESWALTFFLFETRSREYSKYLQIMAKRDPLATYTAAARLADFKAAFGDNIPLLEAQYLRFIGGIKVR